MARFDLHRRAGRLLVDVQADIIPNVGTRLVIPLYARDDAPPSVKRLHPTILIEGRPHVLATHLMAAVPIAELGPIVGSLDDYYDRIVAAIDMIFLGF
ncbi:MAG: CcdB family protein [Devosia sp.]